MNEGTNQEVNEFLELYDKYITRDGSAELLDWIKGSDFLVAPGSTRFHDNYPCGLVHHSLSVYKHLLKLVELHGLKGEYTDETLALCALMHDLCKANLYVQDFRNVKVDGRWERQPCYTVCEQEPLGDHGDKSVIILQRFIKLSNDEIYAIRSHMGGFDAAVRGGSRYLSNAYEKSKLAVLVHFADMSATYLD